jgi:hypothetical protein
MRSVFGTGEFSFKDFSSTSLYPLMWASTLPRYVNTDAISLCELITDAQCNAPSAFRQYMLAIFSNVQAIPLDVKNQLRQIITDDNERMAENMRAELTCCLMECGALSVDEWEKGKKGKFHYVICDEILNASAPGDVFKKYADYAAKSPEFKAQFIPLMLDVLGEEFEVGHVNHAKLLKSIGGLITHPSTINYFIPFLNERLLSVVGSSGNSVVEAESNIMPMINSIWHCGVSELSAHSQQLRDQASNCFIVLACLWLNALKNPENTLSQRGDKDLYQASRVSAMINKMSVIDATLLPLAKEANRDLHQSLLARHLEIKASKLGASLAANLDNGAQNASTPSVSRKI